MNGLDFDHRVLRPWANNPAFYVTVFTAAERSAGARGAFRVRRGGALELRVSADAERAGAARRRHSRRSRSCSSRRSANLVGDKADLWTFGTREIKQQSADLERLAPRVAGAPGTLDGRRRSGRRRRPTRSRVARRAGAVEARAVRRRRRELQLVSEERAAGAVHVAGRGHDHAARAGARARVPRARGAAQRGAAGAGADRERRRLQPPLQRGGHAVHGVPPRPRDHDGPRLHGAGAAGAHRHVQPRAARVLLRSRLPRPPDHAHARLPLVRPGADGEGAAPRTRSGADRCSTTSSSRAPRGTPPAGKR